VRLPVGFDALPLLAWQQPQGADVRRHSNRLCFSGRANPKSFPALFRQCGKRFSWKVRMSPLQYCRISPQTPRNSANSFACSKPWAFRMALRRCGIGSLDFAPGLLVIVPHFLRPSHIIVSRTRGRQPRQAVETKIASPPTSGAIARSSAARSDAGWLRNITLPRCPATTAKHSRKSFRSRGR